MSDDLKPTDEDVLWLSIVKTSPVEEWGKQLEYAAEEGRAWRAKEVIQMYKEQEQTSHERIEALWRHYCLMALEKVVKKGSLETLKVIVESYPEIIDLEESGKTYQASTLGHKAVTGGHKDILEYLLLKGMDNCESLILASMNNRLDLIEVIIDHTDNPQKNLEKALVRLSFFYGYGDDVDLLLSENTDNSLAKENREAVSLLQHYLELIKEEKNLYPIQAHKIKNKTLSELREFKNDHCENGLMVLAVVGEFNLLAEKSKSESNDEIGIKDLTAKNKLKRNILDVMGKQGALDKVFDPALWVGRAKEMQIVWRQLPEQYRDQVNLKEALAQLNRLNFQEKSRQRKPPTP